VPSASIVVPTRGRPAYLDVALASIAPQAERAGAEVIVVDDGGDADTRTVAERHEARYVAHERPLGPNAARNSGIAAAQAPLVVLTEDDVEVSDSWLATLLEAARDHPEVDVFGGPISARLDGVRWRSCGRGDAPISALERGTEDREVDLVYAGNMLLRREALERVGPFASSLGLYEDDDERRRISAGGSAPGAGFYGDEEEWQRRYRAAGGRTRYVADARVVHRREGADARLGALMRAAYARGRVSRRWSQAKGDPPSLASEARVLAGSLWHAGRRGCLNGLVLAAGAGGRLREALGERRRLGAAAPPALGAADLDGADPWLAPGSGLVAGRRANLRARGRDVAADSLALATGQTWRLDRAARRSPPMRSVLVLGVERTDVPGLMEVTRQELRRSRHDVTVAVAAAGAHGKFQNLNVLLEREPATGHDWLLVVDDDVALPRGFLDRFLFCAERFDLGLAQPAHRARSHAAWPVTRRRPGSVARETEFVEIGPVTAFRADTFEALLPFPDLRWGWGLDAHWSALARDRGWRMGIVDATPIGHGLRRTGSGYRHADAVAEARAFLDGRSYVTRDEAARTLAVHRRW